MSSAPHQTSIPDIRAVIEEFGRLLDILGKQLDASLTEADSEYAALGDAFADLATTKNRINAIICLEPQQTILRRGCERIGKSLDSAVVALQYHDRLAQRVGHIRRGLHQLQHLLRDGEQRSFEQWLSLLRNVEHAQTEEQRRLAESVRDNGDFNVELF